MNLARDTDNPGDAAAHLLEYALSASYTVSAGVIITRTDDSSISQLSDLQGKTTAQSATSNWAQVAEKEGAKVEAVEGFTQAVTLVKQQRVDATVNDNLAARCSTSRPPETAARRRHAGLDLEEVLRP